MNESETRKWPLAGLIAFRFLFTYLVLFFFPFPSGLVNPYWLGGFFSRFWAWLVPSVANILNIAIPNENNGGSGDTTFDYLRLLWACIPGTPALKLRFYHNRKV